MKTVSENSIFPLTSGKLTQPHAGEKRDVRNKNIPVQWEEKEDTEDQPDQDFIARGDSEPPHDADTASDDDDEFTPKTFGSSQGTY